MKVVKYMGDQSDDITGISKRKLLWYKTTRLSRDTKSRRSRSADYRHPPGQFNLVGSTNQQQIYGGKNLLPPVERSDGGTTRIKSITLTHSGMYVSVPLFVSVLCGVIVLGIVGAAACIFRYWRNSKSHHLDDGEVNDTSPIVVGHYSQTPHPKGNLKDHNLIISQSTPDLLDDLKTDMVQEEEKIGKRHYKTVVKQSTLPNVPQRHALFQRQLSHKLDLSNVEFTIQSVKYKEQPVAKIKPELYRQNAAIVSSAGPEGILHTETAGSASRTCGRLNFSVIYNHQTDQLIVTIISAEGLPAKDFLGTSDPYVKIYLLPDRKHKYQTKVHRKTLNPIFNETFLFHVRANDTCPGSELYGKMIQFSVYDFDRFSRHDLIGVVMLRDLAAQDLSYEQKYSLNIICVQQEIVDLGELMLSLCYLPTAGRLTVTIIKARNLKAMDITGASDPYVKISLMCQGKRIKKKKTTVCRNTLNPVYNEALVFDVPQENVEEVTIEIKVIDYDRVGSNELMGCCSLGSSHLGPGREHWYEMLENSRKPVAQWYPLQESLPSPSSPESSTEVKHASSKSPLSGVHTGEQNVKVK